MVILWPFPVAGFCPVIDASLAAPLADKTEKNEFESIIYCNYGPTPSTFNVSLDYLSMHQFVPPLIRRIKKSPSR